MQVNQSRQTQPKVGILAISLSAAVVVVVIGWLGVTALNTGGYIEVEGNHEGSQVKVTVSGTEPLANDETDDMDE